MIYLVYPGLGKTYAAQIDNRFVDLKLSRFKNKLAVNIVHDEHLKGKELPFEFNKDFPQNILDYLQKMISQDKIIVMAFKQNNINFLQEHKFDFCFVLPDYDKFEQLHQQYINRGNPPEAIDKFLNGLKNIEDEVKIYNKPIYFIKQNEHLYNLFLK